MNHLDVDAASDDPIVLPAVTWGVYVRTRAKYDVLRLEFGTMEADVSIDRRFADDLRAMHDRPLAAAPVDRGTYRLAWGDPDAPDLHLTVRDGSIALQAPLDTDMLACIQDAETSRQGRSATDVLIVLGYVAAAVLAAAVFVTIVRAY